MRNKLFLCAITICPAIAVLAIASNPPDVSSTFELRKAKTVQLDKKPENLRVFTRVGLDTNEGRRVLKQFQTVSAKSQCQKRLEFICDFFNMDNVSATAWSYTFKAIKRNKDGIAFELEVVPTMLKQRQPAAVVNGVLVEKWVIRAGKKSCERESRGFEGIPVFVVD